MAEGRVRIGLVDSGFSPAQASWVQVAAGFEVIEHQLWLVDAQPDQQGHGTRLLEVIHALAPEAELLMAQVFRQRLTTTAAQVAAAIDWLVKQKVDLINLSLGLRQHREVLQQACERAFKAGVHICAASPARGEPVYPASYPGVFRMTGDARCDRYEIAHLETAFADFAGCVKPINGQQNLSGASIGCAHMSAHIARYLAEQRSKRPSQVRQWLIQQAHYQGAERRSS